MADKETIDRRLLRSGVQKIAKDAMGPAWARLKELVSRAGLSDEEKIVAANQIIEDVRLAVNEICDQQKKRVALSQVQPEHDDE